MLRGYGIMFIGWINEEAADGDPERKFCRLKEKVMQKS